MYKEHQCYEIVWCANESFCLIIFLSISIIVCEIGRLQLISYKIITLERLADGEIRKMERVGDRNMFYLPVSIPSSKNKAPPMML